MDNFSDHQLSEYCEFEGHFTDSLQLSRKNSFDDYVTDEDRDIRQYLDLSSNFHEDDFLGKRNMLGDLQLPMIDIDISPSNREPSCRFDAESRDDVSASGSPLPKSPPAHDIDFSVSPKPFTSQRVGRDDGPVLPQPKQRQTNPGRLNLQKTAAIVHKLVTRSGIVGIFKKKLVDAVRAQQPVETQLKLMEKGKYNISKNVKRVLHVLYPKGGSVYEHVGPQKKQVYRLKNLQNLSVCLANSALQAQHDQQKRVVAEKQAHLDLLLRKHQMIREIIAKNKEAERSEIISVDCFQEFETQPANQMAEEPTFGLTTLLIPRSPGQEVSFSSEDSTSLRATSNSPELPAWTILDIALQRGNL